MHCFNSPTWINSITSTFSSWEKCSHGNLRFPGAKKRNGKVNSGTHAAIVNCFDWWWLWFGTLCLDHFWDAWALTLGGHILWAAPVNMWFTTLIALKECPVCLDTITGGRKFRRVKNKIADS